jgi:hypothetical protein
VVGNILSTLRSFAFFAALREKKISRKGAKIAKSGKTLGQYNTASDSHHLDSLTSSKLVKS